MKRGQFEAVAIVLLVKLVGLELQIYRAGIIPYALVA